MIAFYIGYTSRMYTYAYTKLFNSFKTMITVPFPMSFFMKQNIIPQAEMYSFQASALKEEADSIANRYPGVESVFMDIIERPDILKELVQSADIVISLLPYKLHHLVAESCIETKTNMVTASYCTPELKEMHQRYVAKFCTVKIQWIIYDIMEIAMMQESNGFKLMNGCFVKRRNT